MMKSKSLSVIIPVYNADRYIGECLNSFSELSISDMEIIVVNDGSTDKTKEIVEECIQKDSRICIYNVQNGGVSRARNYGIDRAKGKYIMFLDADDYLLKGAFDYFNKALLFEYDFVAFSRTIVEKNGKKWDSLFPLSEAESGDKAIIDCFMYADSLFNECWGKLYKKSIIDGKNVRFPVDIPIGEDAMFVTEYYAHCSSVHVYNVPLVAYRQHDSSCIRKTPVNERIKYTDMLYEYSKEYIPDEIKDKSLYYNFKILTNLCREYSKEAVSVDAIKAIYLSDVSSKILENINGNTIPLYRKHEYFLIRNRIYFLSAVYYRIKAMIT